MTASSSFPGFQDETNNAYIRLVALPGGAFAEIEKTMTNDALRKQGMAVDKRESLKLPGGRAILLSARQQADGIQIRKWLLIVPLKDVTALVSFEMPVQAASRYPDAAIRKALVSVVARAKVPDEEQLALLPFRVGEMAGMRVARVVPGVAVQLTDGPKDSFDDATDQPHVVISVAPGGPARLDDRDNFARLAFTGLPALKDVKLVNSESMRISGLAGHELRAEGKDAKSGSEIVVVQWLRFGTGGYMRILAFAPKENWNQSFTRFRAVRDGLGNR
ncbi:MAG: hypothetical protein FJX62_05420 [Alphaproteobacteria bacterium]|nr:hypothetical protein [Alphaproteobacteria bacterium]